MERRRVAGGALAIDMASLRSVGRCEQFGALLRRMPRAPLARARPPHLLCIYSGTAGAGDAGMSVTTDFYLPIPYAASQRARCG
ncbi:unnamed protein product [Colias eurytheme]|nr:unnamed protein product [Colias eurytheme]